MTRPPEIYDVAELPEDEKGGECPMYDEDDVHGTPTRCNQRIEYVFVYEASADEGDDSRKNCLACGDCSPEITTLIADGGEAVSQDPRWDSALDNSDLRELAEQAWGMDAQKNKAAEELSELAACLNRDLNGQQDWQEFVEELVDARIMLWQMERWVRDDHLEAELRDSLRSLRARLPEGVDE